jgi:predicted O-methyltransferase YrrM
MRDWRGIIGGQPDEHCDRVYATKPDWVKGTVSSSDARYLFSRVLDARTSLVVEIGTASGFSTVFLCHALELARRAGLVGDDYRVVSYDISKNYYVDPARAAGDAARALLEPEQLEHVTFRHPATAIDVGADYASDPLSLMFLDANHGHPWPTLDLLATLDALRPGAEVILHDINLPVRCADFQAWGVKHLFDSLDADKSVDPGEAVPNIGSVRIPADKDGFRDQLLTILFAHDWEENVEVDTVTAALA